MRKNRTDFCTESKILGFGPGVEILWFNPFRAARLPFAEIRLHNFLNSCSFETGAKKNSWH